MQPNRIPAGHPANGPAAAAPVSKRLAPGRDGTKRCRAQYGDALVCVRYRHDAAGGKRYTTVEIVVDERKLPGSVAPQGLPLDETIAVRIDFHETGLRDRAKKGGARWDTNRRIWLMPFQLAQRLGLTGRVRRLNKGDGQNGNLYFQIWQSHGWIWKGFHIWK